MCFFILFSFPFKDGTTLHAYYCELILFYIYFRVGAGYSHSLFIVRNQTDQEKKEIEKFPVLDQSNMD